MGLPVSIVVISYMDGELLRSCYESIRRWYPCVPVIIIDGSEKNSLCWCYASKDLSKHTNTVVKCVEHNIGHGKGMNLGIGIAKTRHILLMDSDVVITRPGIIEAMFKMFETGDIYGVGKVVLTNKHGHNTDDFKNGITYLHPHFSMIDKEVYFKYPKFCHHGAPLIKAMREVHEQKEHPVIHFPVEHYISHKGRGTRKQNPEGFHPRNWEKL